MACLRAHCGELGGRCCHRSIGPLLSLSSSKPPLCMACFTFSSALAIATVAISCTSAAACTAARAASAAQSHDAAMLGWQYFAILLAAAASLAASADRAFAVVIFGITRSSVAFTVTVASGPSAARATPTIDEQTYITQPLPHSPPIATSFV